MNSWYDAILFWASDSAAIVDRSLSSWVPAGITMSVFCDHTDSENSAMQIRIRSWRWMTRILHLEKYAGRRDRRNHCSHATHSGPRSLFAGNPTAFAGWTL